MITRQDMIERYGEREIAELTDHENGRDIDEIVLKRAIGDGIAEAESYILSVAKFTVAPYSLKIKVCDIARYYLHEDSITEIVENRYKRAIEWLKEAQDNPSMLNGPDIEKKSGIRIIKLTRG